MAGDVFWKNYFLLCNLRLASAFIAQNVDILCMSTGILFRFGYARCREHKEGMARFHFFQDPGGIWLWPVTTCPYFIMFYCLSAITLSSSLLPPSLYGDNLPRGFCRVAASIFPEKQEQLLSISWPQWHTKYCI
jgi:hypothetical protein